jgi:hypothetical protein
MTAEIINLRRVRRAKERAEREKQANENRVVHGRTVAERRKVRTEREAAKRHLDDHRREDS